MTLKTKKTAYIKHVAKALERFSEVFSIYDETHQLVFANSAAYDAMPAYFNALNDGHSIREAIRRQIISTHGSISDSCVEEYTTIIADKFYNCEFFEVPTIGDRVIQVTHEKLDTQFTLGLGMDVTKLMRQKAKMKTLAQENFDLANTDQLTKLANRRHFIETLTNKIAKSQSSNSSFFVGLLDLNGFKRINDLYGHAIGDQLLTRVAKIAVEHVEKDTFLARLGGDEFALILNSKHMTEPGLLTYGEALCEAISQTCLLSGNDVSVSASLGWASFPKDGETTSDLLRKSDYALYKSKYSKTQKPVIFSGLDESVILRQSETIRQLESADLETELEVEFQPIHDIKNGTITGFEALVRWASPVLGAVSPMEFIPLAEKTGHISKLTKIILKKSLSVAATWPKSISLHFNISAVDLGKIDVIHDLISIIQRSGYPLQSVIFEVTETVLIDTFEKISKVFDLFRETGIRLALDDFGVGYSSLSYLTRIPVSCLKVDKSFTQRLSPGSDEEKILKTVKYLCEDLEIDCIVEGIEKASQVDQLTSLGLHNMQGFYFSRSLKTQHLGAYLLQHIPGLHPQMNSKLIEGRKDLSLRRAI